MSRTYSAYSQQQFNAAIANQNLIIAIARKFDHDHADEIAMCKVEGRSMPLWIQYRNQSFRLVQKP